jgi:hypothetical protein
MTVDPKKTKIYHITDVSNLAGILADGGLYSDAKMRALKREVTEIGYSHIKQRRLDEYKIKCCSGRAVGEFVPFYFCPRSPMLSTINRGSTGRPVGCQSTIVHLVSSFHTATSLGRQWAISDGNAGASYTNFSNGNDALQKVDWEIVGSNSWGGDRLHVKMTEFLISDFFPFASFVEIGCHNADVVKRVNKILGDAAASFEVHATPLWYY